LQAALQAAAPESGARAWACRSGRAAAGASAARSDCPSTRPRPWR
jgi:hypothetical protein